MHTLLYGKYINILSKLEYTQQKNCAIIYVRHFFLPVSSKPPEKNSSNYITVRKLKLNLLTSLSDKQGYKILLQE